MASITTQTKEAHHIDFNDKYPTWGLAGHENHEDAARNGAFDIRAATETKRTEGCEVMNETDIDLTGFTLSQAAIVPFYQGPTHSTLTNNILLRYSRNNGINNHMGGEHISAVIDLDGKRLMGTCRMLIECDGSSFVQPDQALSNALAFIQKNAQDLPLNTCPSLPLPEQLAAGQGIEVFSQDDESTTAGYPIGALALHWIDQHAEQIHSDTLYETNGMKVKFRFNDNSERYAWVIIDKNGSPHVFERNIFWDFANDKRGTQMWLHDGWLKAHQIDLMQYAV